MSLFTKKYVCRYGNRYHGLTLDEAYAIRDYMKENSHVIMGRLLKSNVTLSEGFRIFLADLVAGKITRPAGNPPFIRRDFKIFEAVVMRMRSQDQPGLPLRSSKKGPGVFATIGGEYGLLEDTVEQIYKRVKRSAPLSSKRSELVHVEIVLERIPHPAFSTTDSHYCSADGTITKTTEHIPAYPADNGDAEIE